MKSMKVMKNRGKEGTTDEHRCGKGIYHGEHRGTEKERLECRVSVATPAAFLPFAQRCIEDGSEASLFYTRKKSLREYVIAAQQAGTDSRELQNSSVSPCPLWLKQFVDSLTH